MGGECSAMAPQFALAYHFVAELLAARHEYPRIPEPEAMEEAESVQAFQEATLPTGNGSSVHLFNLMMLCGNLKPGSLVVDLACGPANLLVALAELNPDSQFIGVDLSTRMLAWAEKARSTAGIHNLRFVHGDITRLDAFSSGSVDLVMSTLSLHHLPDAHKLAACMQEVARVLKSPATNPNTGLVYLMDFAALKRQASADYFVEERTKGLNHHLKLDYINSLRAAFQIDELAAAAEPLRALPEQPVTLRQTWGVPFAILLTNLATPRLSPMHTQALGRYWAQMKPAQRRDFKDLRMFLGLGGASVPSPASLGWRA